MTKPDVIIGIDPGISGAIAFIDIKKDNIEIFDVPTITVESSGKKKSSRNKKDYDKMGMSELLKKYAGRKVLVVMEHVHAMPGQGVTSMFNFGRGVGLWEGLFAAYGWEPEMMTPQSWKKKFGERLLNKSLPKPDILKLTRPEYNRLSVLERKKYDEANKAFEAQKKSTKEHAKGEAVLLAIELYPKLVDLFKRKKDSDRAEALLIAEQKRREIYD